MINLIIVKKIVLIREKMSDFMRTTINYVKKLLSGTNNNPLLLQQCVISSYPVSVCFKNKERERKKVKINKHNSLQGENA